MTLRERMRRLFAPESPVEAKASRKAKLIALASSGQPVWTPRDLSSLAREGFTKNPVVYYRAVRMISEAAASVPLFQFDGGARDRRAPALGAARQAERGELRA